MVCSRLTRSAWASISIGTVSNNGSCSKSHMFSIAPTAWKRKKAVEPVHFGFSMLGSRSDAIHFKPFVETRESHQKFAKAC